ncbi:hypothetical protein DFH06DRAFT_1225349 [Mycena polygramma]|nr:hypothetical protein DFH06DRAFT_1225349 [Mycena polygramma]
MLAGLAADRARVAELQSQILDLERALCDLRIEQLQAQERLDSYRYPVLILPNEVASEIFIRILPPHPHFPPLVGSHSPTLLTQICRQWRDIALSIPTLWSFISTYRDQHVDPGHFKAHICRWLERSRSYPLHLRLGRLERADNDLVEAFISHRARWEYLVFRRKKMDLDVFGGPMPLLRHLDLVVDKRPVDSFSLREVPLLRIVTLNGLAASRIILPWAQLTSLTLLDVYPSEFVPILVQTLNLVRCELGVYFLGPNHPGARPDITLGYLQTLVLTHSGGHPEADLLSAFVIPTLRALKIPEDFLSPSPIDSLTAFISKSGCRLEKLYITNGESSREASYRQAFPSLRKFSITKWLPW